MATNPYTSQSVPTSYNQNPPPDDGTEVAANEIEWQKHVDKLGDPLKDYGENINSATSTAFGKTINTDADENNALAGSLAYTSSELTISAGTITPTRSHHTVDTESDAATDDLDTINTTSVSDGAILILRAENSGRVVTVKNATGNINLLEDQDVDLGIDTRLILQRRSTEWDEIAGRIRVSATTLVDNALPAASTDEQTGVTISDANELTVIAKDLSINTNGTDVVFQIGDATDYTTNVTALGQTVDESGVVGVGWGTNNGVVIAANLAAATVVQCTAFFRKVTDDVAVSMFGAGFQAWSVQLFAQQDGSLTDRCYGNGFIATSKTVDRIRLNATNNFDAGRWAAQKV